MIDLRSIPQTTFASLDDYLTPVVPELTGSPIGVYVSIQAAYIETYNQRNSRMVMTEGMMIPVREMRDEHTYIIDWVCDYYRMRAVPINWVKDVVRI